MSRDFVPVRVLVVFDAELRSNSSLTCLREDTFPRLASDRARRMIFAKSGLKLRAKDSLSVPFTETSAATGFLFEVISRDSFYPFAAVDK